MRKNTLLFTLLLVLSALVSSSVHAGKLINLRFQPVLALTKFYQGDLMVAPLDFLSLGVVYTSFSAKSGVTSLSARSFGPRLVYHFSGGAIGDSWVLGVQAQQIPIVISSSIGTIGYSTTVNSTMMAATMAYQWVWGSGFNLTLGAGANYINMSTTAKVTADTGQETEITVPGYTGFLPWIDISVGWAFL